MPQRHDNNLKNFYHIIPVTSLRPSVSYSFSLLSVQKYCVRNSFGFCVATENKENLMKNDSMKTTQQNIIIKFIGTVISLLTNCFFKVIQN